jgi:hypothetical protein
VTRSGRGPIYRNVSEENHRNLLAGYSLCRPGTFRILNGFGTLTSRKIDKALYLLGIEQR